MKFQPGQQIAEDKVLDFKLSRYQDAVLAAQETLDTLMLQLADLERQADDIDGLDASAVRADARIDVRHGSHSQELELGGGIRDQHDASDYRAQLRSYPLDKGAAVCFDEGLVLTQSRAGAAGEDDATDTARTVKGDCVAVWVQRLLHSQGPAASSRGQCGESWCQVYQRSNR